MVAGCFHVYGPDWESDFYFYDGRGIARVMCAKLGVLAQKLKEGKMVKLPVVAEFRKYDEEMRTMRKRNADGTVGGEETFRSRVLRCEVQDEGCIVRLWDDVLLPVDLCKGDRIMLEVNGMEVLKEQTYLRVSRVRKVAGDVPTVVGPVLDELPPRMDGGRGSVGGGSAMEEPPRIGDVGKVKR